MARMRSSVYRIEFDARQPYPMQIEPATQRKHCIPLFVLVIQGADIVTSNRAAERQDTSTDWQSVLRFRPLPQNSVQLSKWYLLRLLFVSWARSPIRKRNRINSKENRCETFSKNA